MDETPVVKQTVFCPHCHTEVEKTEDGICGHCGEKV